MSKRGVAEAIGAFVSLPAAVFLILGMWPGLLAVGIGGMTWVVTR